jgi:BMFP domain-containing protein YqiC
MEKPDFLNELNEKLCKALPSSLRSMKQDIGQNFHAILQSTFNKLELVTREEFDVQVKVLARTRKKIEMLESEIKKLEKLLDDKQR